MVLHTDHKEYGMIQKILGETLSMKWALCPSDWLAHNPKRNIHNLLDLAYIATSLRGIRRNVRSIPFKEGAAVPYFEFLLNMLYTKLSLLLPELAKGLFTY